MTAGPTDTVPTAHVVVDVAVPFLDSRALDLCWALGLPVQAALAARAVDVADTVADAPGVVVELRVLGGSHQVVVRRPGRADFTETVACGLTGATPLPGSLTRPGYRFEARTTRHDAGALGARVDALTACLREDPHALVGRFPGHPHAVTALRVETGAVLSWRTWHAYPQAGELVSTRSTLDHAPVHSPVHGEEPT